MNAKAGEEKESAVDPFSAQMSTTEMEIDRESFALVVVDMVNEFLDRERGLMPVADPAPVIDATNRLVDAVREAGGLVIWVRPGHTELADGLFRKRTPHGLGDDHGTQVHRDLNVLDSEKVVRKRKYSSFFGTDLDSYLREHRIRSLLVSGVALNICVRSTVHDAFFNSYDTFVVEDACQATSQREHDSTVYDIDTHFGSVLTLAEVYEALGATDPAAGQSSSN